MHDAHDMSYVQSLPKISEILDRFFDHLFFLLQHSRCYGALL
jgi:hypothetical protein